jgi:hypothetical protein
MIYDRHDPETNLNNIPVPRKPFVYLLGGWIKTGSAISETVQVYTYDTIIKSTLLP